jgi:hypothetical protein
MERLARLRQQLAPVAAAAAAPAAGVGGNVERPWWETPAGTKRSYSHQLGPSVEAWAPGRALPVLVAQGAQPGPTLLVSAGIHGNEYDGMVALRRVWEELDPSELSGTFVAIMCCNVDAHLVPDRNSAYDGQNLARVFPGKVDGTLTERVAYCIQHDFIEKCSLMCDLHTAGLDMSEQPVSAHCLPAALHLSVVASTASAHCLPAALCIALHTHDSRAAAGMIPIIGYTLNPPPHNPDALEQARSAAKAFGLKTIWSNAVRNTETKRPFFAPFYRKNRICNQTGSGQI